MDSTPPGGSAVTVVGSLALVLGLFFALVWLSRRTVNPASLTLPGEVVEVLGRAALVGRQQMYLVRCGRKLLLVSVTPAGAETLTEITDPEEAERLAGICQQARPGSSTSSFRQVFQSLARPGRATDEVADEVPPSRFGLSPSRREAAHAG